MRCSPLLLLSAILAITAHGYLPRTPAMQRNGNPKSAVRSSPFDNSDSSKPLTSTSTALNFSGGASSSSSSPMPVARPRSFSSFLSCTCLSLMLLRSILRLYPHTLPPLTSATPTTYFLYATSILMFLYSESYKGFHLKFNQTYLTRSHRLPSFWRLPLLNILYSGGWVQSSLKRKITSWGVTFGVAILIVISKKLNPLCRGVLDVGVVAGLSGAVVSLWGLWIKSFVDNETVGAGAEGY